ncbi:MAG TPA: hypothetical protein PKE39_01505 [Ignavibacteria bacterium]|nr:hypothetical protein [Ignavibacteria bacterium]HMQ97674.1 hypothetical protein [Ignavibacteria bacterium]
MIKSSLLQILSSISSQELREFGDYVRSPFFNKNESVIKLYDYIAIKYPDLNDELLNKEKVFQKLFPGAKYNESFMKTLIFNLSHLAEEYLGYVQYRNEPMGEETRILRELEERNIEGLFLRKLKAAEGNLEKVKYKNENFYLSKYNMQSFREAHWLSNQRFLNYKDLPEQEAYTKYRSILTFFFIKILKEFSLVYTQKKIVNFEYEFEFMDTLFEYLKDNYEKYNSTLLSLVFNKALMLKEGRPEYYLKTKELLVAEMDKIVWIDRFNAMSALSAFAIDQFYKGSPDYMKERFELHKIILENNLYSSSEKGGYFDEQLFINIVVVAIQMKEPDWCENFIKKYEPQLNPEYKINPGCISRARLSLAFGRHEEALRYLSRITSLDKASYKTGVKNLTLMLYFEMSRIVEALDAADTYRKFLSRDNLLPKAQRERNSNFLKYYNSLLKFSGSKEALSKVHIEISNTFNINERQWLLEKIEQLMKN